MKSFILSTVIALSAFTASANAGLMIDATHGPIQVTVSGR